MTMLAQWLGLAALAAAPAWSAGDGFVSLFNGRDLAGWQGAEGLWWVEKGVLVGSSDSRRIVKNTFLIHERPVSDFVLQFEVKLRNGNSGVQFRSTRLDDFVVTGYQADLSDAGDRSAWGNLYEERGRGRGLMRTPDEGWRKAEPVLRKGDWNRYEVHAEGSRIRLRLNGVLTIDTTDSAARKGVLALQLHAGEPMRVEFRNLRIRDLKGAR